MTDHPLERREGTSAAPIGPEPPLTKILEFITNRMSLYQFIEWRANTERVFEIVEMLETYVPAVSNSGSAGAAAWSASSN